MQQVVENIGFEKVFVCMYVTVQFFELKILNFIVIIKLILKIVQMLSRWDTVTLLGRDGTTNLIVTCYAL